MSKVRTRFAPSPTGMIHVGNLRTALYAYLIAKHEGGDFILRIEDTDQERFVEGAIDAIYKTIKETGLEFDEGPDIDKGFGPYVQSERQNMGLYKKYAQQLIDENKAYYCFCTKERLESLKENGENKENQMYDKHCLSLSKEEIEENLKNNVPYVIRFNISNVGTTSFDDEIYGKITVENKELDDFVLIKSDGYPTYNFANVIDDHLMEISHVVRGNEYLSSSPKYNLLYEAFGWEVPTYVHLPLITDENHAKLSKRSGHSSYNDLINAGFLPKAIVNYVALLGWSPSINEEKFSLEELIKEFDYKRVNKSPAVFDINKLRWLNSEYIKEMDFDSFKENALPILKDSLKKEYDYDKILDCIKSRIETYNDIPQMVSFFDEVAPYEKELYINKKNKTDLDNSLIVLKELKELLTNIQDFTNDNLFNILKEYSQNKEYKVGFTMWILRIAVSGLLATPCGATEILSLIGKDETLKRIDDAIAFLN